MRSPSNLTELQEASWFDSVLLESQRSRQPRLETNKAGTVGMDRSMRNSM